MSYPGGNMSGGENVRGIMSVHHLETLTHTTVYELI